MSSYYGKVRSSYPLNTTNFWPLRNNSVKTKRSINSVTEKIDENSQRPTYAKSGSRNRRLISFPVSSARLEPKMTFRRYERSKKRVKLLNGAR